MDSNPFLSVSEDVKIQLTAVGNMQPPQFGQGGGAAAAVAAATAVVVRDI